MLKLKRVLGLSGLLGLLAAAAFAVPASAAVKGECIVDGEAKTEDKAERDLGVRLIGGEGKFTFESIALTCVGDTDKDEIPEVVTDLTATATGWYDNTVCGTGKAFGTVTQIRGTNATQYQALVGEEFAVQFLDFAGVFKWRDWDKPDAPVPKLEPESDDPTKNTYDGTPAGEIQLLPPTRKPTPTVDEEVANIQRGQCTKAFRATGTVLVDFVD